MPTRPAALPPAPTGTPAGTPVYRYGYGRQPAEAAAPPETAAYYHVGHGNDDMKNNNNAYRAAQAALLDAAASATAAAAPAAPRGTGRGTAARPRTGPVNGENNAADGPRWNNRHGVTTHRDGGPNGGLVHGREDNHGDMDKDDENDDDVVLTHGDDDDGFDTDDRIAGDRHAYRRRKPAVGDFGGSGSGGGGGGGSSSRGGDNGIDFDDDAQVEGDDQSDDDDDERGSSSRVDGSGRGDVDGETLYDDDDDADDDDDDDGDDDDDDVDDVDDDGAVRTPGEGRLVRQNSSFARLSADSWLTVVSEYENDGPNENLLFAQVEEEPRNAAANAAAASEMHAVSALAGRSVLDCVVDLLRGTRAQKRKLLRRYGERWIWLGEDLLSLNWKSKKRGTDMGGLNLTKVKKLRSVDRELIVETNDSHKLALTLSTRDEAITWLTGLSCLVPKKAKVFETNKILKERINYDPLRDSWRGKPVSTRKRVNEYIMLGGIGKGSFGKVKLALSTVDKRFYACKIITNHRRNNGSSSLSNREEQAVLRKLAHPNIVRHRDVLYDADEDRYCVVIEYMARGVVMDSSKLEGVKPLSEDGVREIMRDVVSGLEYLHYQRIVHRDIKPDNLLRCGDGTVKISDFGEARMYDVSSVEQNKNAAPGTPAFIAPELCMSDKSPKAPSESYAADVWSLGASLFYMVYGRAPFLAKSVFEIYDSICTQKLRFPDQPKISRKLKDLIKKMLTKEPKSRATLQEVAKHTWFSERVDPGKLVKIRITQADVAGAIAPATWIIPPERLNA